jgi:hypothetical protein
MKTKLIIIFLILFSIYANAQITMEFGMAGTKPLCVFGQNNYRNGLGYSFTMLSKPIPDYYAWQVQFGFNFNHFNAGRELFSINTIEPWGRSATYKVKNYNNALSFKIRVVSRPAPVRLFADLDLGYRHFVSKERTVLSENYGGYDKVTKSNLTSSGHVFAGLSLGLLFRLSTNFYLNLYSRLDYGAPINWLELNSVQKSTFINYPDYSNYRYHRTTSTLLWVGFTFSFYINESVGTIKTPRSSTPRPTSPSTSPSTPKPTTPKTTPPKTSPPSPTPKPAPTPRPSNPRPTPTPPPSAPR